MYKGLLVQPANWCIMGCSQSKSKEHAVYVLETEVPDLMAGGALHNEYETKKNYLDVYGKPPPDDTNNKDPHNSTSHKDNKRHGHGKSHKHRKKEEEEEGDDEGGLDIDGLIQVEGPQAVNDKQTHAHSSVSNLYKLYELFRTSIHPLHSHYHHYHRYDHYHHYDPYHHHRHHRHCFNFTPYYCINSIHISIMNLARVTKKG